MKIYELAGNVFDAQAEGLNILRNMKKRSKLNESASEQIDNYIQAISGYEIPQQSLQLGKQYCPLMFMHDAVANQVSILLTVEPVTFVKEQGSRLLFRYQQSNIDLTFPADGYSSPNDVRIICDSKIHADQVVSQFVLSFDKNIWDTSVHGFDPTNGQIRRVTNI